MKGGEIRTDNSLSFSYTCPLLFVPCPPACDYQVIDAKYSVSEKA
jgi:hypothetical protein